MVCFFYGLFLIFLGSSTALPVFAQQAHTDHTPKATTVASSFSPSTVVSGTVRETESGEAVIGISVVLSRDSSKNVVAPHKPGQQASTAPPPPIVRGGRTNKFGFFSLPDVPSGTYFLIVRGIGYAPLVQQIHVPLHTPLALAVSAQGLQMGQITVTSVHSAHDVRQAVQSISRVEVRAETLARLPSFGGQKDVFRALQLLPGIQTVSETSSGLYVRGGSTDQNLTLLDGALLYNPSHLAGFFSTFNADALQDIRLYKGAFPAEYGGRLSSVIDLTMREGNNKRIKGNATLSTIILEANVEGPVVSSNATFMLSGRRMVLDWLVEAQTALTDNIPQDAPLPLYYFYDVNAKFSAKLSDNDRLSLSLYTGRDRLGIDANDISLGLGWGNLSGNLRWAHLVSPEMFTTCSLIYTRYDYGTSLAARLGDSRLLFSTLSQIEDWTLKAEALWTPNAQHNIKAGTEFIWHTFGNSVGNRLEAPTASLRASENSGRLGSTEWSVFVQDEWQMHERLVGNLGLRASWFQNVPNGASSVPTPQQATGTFLNIEPRLSAGYEVVNDGVHSARLTGSFSVVNQYVHLLSRNDISLPSDIWLPSTADIVPSRAFQYTLGAETSLANNELSLSVEGYYKTLHNLYEYRDGTVLNSLNLNRLDEQLTLGTGEMYGVEVLLERKSGALTGWLGYTLSWATRTFAELNGGRPFFPRYDRRHNFNVALSYVLNDQWEFGATWTYMSGQPITLPAGQANLPDLSGAELVSQTPPSHTSLPQMALPRTPVPSYYFTERNGSRMTAFHKLDISITARTAIFIFPGEYYLSIYNVYNNMNPFAWIIAPTSDPTAPNIVKPVIQQLTIFPILPTIGIRIKF